jgi:drug/metabolite transporter (DMT)-like permease
VTAPKAGSSALIGAGWMLVSVLTFSGISVSARALARDLPAGEILFLRALVGLTAMLPWLVRGGLRVIATRKPMMHVMRGIVSAAAMLCWFAALGFLPVGDAIAIQFTMPLFLLLLAALVLGEKVDAQRWIAVAIGFLGALVIIRPGFQTVTVAVGLVLASAVFYAGNHTFTRAMASTEGGIAIAFYMNLVHVPVAGIAAAFDWRALAWHHLGWVVALGLCGSYSHVFLTRAFAHAEASALAPLDFLRLPIASTLAYWLFGDVSDGWTWFGAAIVFAAGLAITRREHALSRNRGPMASVE